MLSLGPNNTAENPPEYCPPTTECQITRLQTLRNTCGEPQGIYEPIVCMPGYYCPQGGQQQQQCPTNHYCPLGAFEPIGCDLISPCPAGSARQYPLNGLVALVIIDLVLLIIIGWPFLLSNWQSCRSSKPHPPLEDPESNSEKRLQNHGLNDKDPLTSTDTNALNLQRFVKSLSKCIGVEDIGLEIGFDRLTLQLKKDKKMILNEVSGTIEKGSLLAVMGASGAGKCKYIFIPAIPAIFVHKYLTNSLATFVRVLMGKIKHTSGSILINGVPKGMSE